MTMICHNDPNADRNVTPTMLKIDTVPRLAMRVALQIRDAPNGSLSTALIEVTSAISTTSTSLLQQKIELISYSPGYNGHKYCQSAICYPKVQNHLLGGRIKNIIAFSSDQLSSEFSVS